MPQIGWFEILIIVSIAIIVVGPKDIPFVLKKIGTWIGSVKRYVQNVQNEVSSLDEEIISKISELSGVELSQRTPERVSHRRADKIRKRKVVDLYDIMVNEDTVEFKLKAQSGTYIKELVTSDNGRTIPSVAGLLDLECKVEWLDVLDIHSN